MGYVGYAADINVFLTLPILPLIVNNIYILSKAIDIQAIVLEMFNGIPN